MTKVVTPVTEVPIQTALTAWITHQRILLTFAFATMDIMKKIKDACNVTHGVALVVKEPVMTALTAGITHQRIVKAFAFATMNTLVTLAIVSQLEMIVIRVALSVNFRLRAVVAKTVTRAQRYRKMDCVHAQRTGMVQTQEIAVGVTDPVEHAVQEDRVAVTHVSIILRSLMGLVYVILTISESVKATIEKSVMYHVPSAMNTHQQTVPVATPVQNGTMMDHVNAQAVILENLMTASSAMKSVLRVFKHRTTVHHVAEVPIGLMQDRTEIVSVAMGIPVLLQTVFKYVILHAQPATELQSLTV